MHFSGWVSFFSGLDIDFCSAVFQLLTPARVYLWKVISTKKKKTALKKEQLQDNACKLRSILACHFENEPGKEMWGKQGREERVETGTGTRETTDQDRYATRKRNLSELAKGICLFWANLPVSRRRQRNRGSLSLSVTYWSCLAARPRVELRWRFRPSERTGAGR